MCLVLLPLPYPQQACDGVIGKIMIAYDSQKTLLLLVEETLQECETKQNKVIQNRTQIGHWAPAKTPVMPHDMSHWFWKGILEL